jgi:hypothetical protein
MECSFEPSTKPFTGGPGVQEKVLFEKELS